MCKLDKPISIPLSYDTIEEIIKTKNYHCEYQPIIDTRTEKIEAYEALARFEYRGTTISPESVFQSCHEYNELFFNLELALKKFQFENRIEKAKLFINFDPHVFLYKIGVNQIFELFSMNKNFVIELVENSHTVVNTKRLINLFEQHNYSFAVDDFFKENSMVSMYLLNRCEYLKLDKDILSELKRNPSFFHIVDGIVKFAHNLDRKVILEGVETQEDILIARRRNIDLVQGFLYKKFFVIKR